MKKAKLVGGLNSYEEIYNYNIIFFFSKVNATIIQDFQKENYINDLINIICETNSFNKKIKFNIILDDIPNAYVNHNNILFLILLRLCI